MKGRKPKSLEEKRLSGNAGKRPIEVLPVITVTVPLSEYAAPGDLTLDAQAKWNEFIPRLRDLNLLRETDLETLRMLCIEIACYNEARKIRETQGSFYETASKHGSMLRVHPVVGIMERAARQIIKLMESLGMTSVSRVRALATGVQSRQLNLPFIDPAPTAPGAKNDGPVGYLHSRAIN